MELRLDPVVPMHRRDKNGHVIFNKGYRHAMRGKTYEEFFGEERAKEIRKKQSEAQKGRPRRHDPLAAAKPCIAIDGQGRVAARFPSAVEAARRLGLHCATVRRYLRGDIKRPGNGWRWFYEKESWKWCDLVNG